MTDSQFKDNAAAVGKLFGKAAQLAKKQAALATINKVTLPKIYHAIGKRLISAKKLPPDLEQYRDKIQQLEAAIAAESPATQQDGGEGVAAKASRLAKLAMSKASKATADAAASVQVQAAYVSLGRDAVSKYGNKAVPAEFAAELAAVISTRDNLRAEVDAIQASPRRGILSPSRIALAGAVLFGLFGVFAVGRVGGLIGLGGSHQATSERASPRRAVEEGRFVPRPMVSEADLESAPNPPNKSEMSLPPLYESHRASILTVQEMFADQGRRDVPTRELIKIFEELAGGHAMNRSRQSTLKHTQQLRDFAAQTGRSLDQMREEMREHKASVRAVGSSDAAAEQGYIHYHKDVPVTAGVREDIVCPDCMGRGYADPNNPAKGDCLMCGGTGKRKIGRRQ